MQGHPLEQGRDAAGKAGTGLRYSAGEAHPRCLHAARLVELLQVPRGARVHRPQSRQPFHLWQEHNLLGK